MFKEKKPNPELHEEQKKAIEYFRELEGDIEKKELTPEQAAEKKQKKSEMFESLAEEALCKGLLDSDTDFRQTASFNVKKAIEWLKLNGRSFEDSKKWTKDKIKELAKEAKKKKDKRKIELCRELKGVLRSFKEEK